MKRWNGWGEDHTVYAITDQAKAYLANQLGEGDRIPDASMEETITSMPASRLPSSLLFYSTPEIRLHHARGQSLPDWIALRSGRIISFPDGVAFPTSSEDIQALFTFASGQNTRLIPYGGGTSVVGHINPPHDDQPCLTVDLSRMNRMVDLDETSHLATFEAGVRGTDLESRLSEKGFLLGHFPQSFEYSTLGGWIATRSSGQQSYHYGRIEDLFAGGVVETPSGCMELPPFPASAAGPDLRHLVLGSEGRIGIITRATMRVRPQPQFEGFYGVMFKEWEAGVMASRAITQEGIPVSMLRLSDATETETTFVMAGKPRLVALAGLAFDTLGYRDGRCLLIYGVTGDRRQCALSRDRVNSLVRKYDGLGTGEMIGNIWRKTRFKTPYLRNSLWDCGYALDTLETALPWKHLSSAYSHIRQAIRSSFEQVGEKVLILAHLSHFYRDGVSLYITLIFRRNRDPEQTLAIWQRMKSAASQTIVEVGGTISHQHGVGRDHAPYLKHEKGEIGVDLLRKTIETCDPDGMLNPGVLLEE
jgi:alkyldihydroxyacetonephosphate synthase